MTYFPDIYREMTGDINLTNVNNTASPFRQIHAGFGDNAAENALAQANNQSFQNYQQNFAPLIEGMIDNMNSTSLVDTAKENAGQLLGRTTSMQNREASRSLSQLSPAQRMALQRRRDLNSKTQDNQNVNQARIDQDQLNFENMSNLMNIAVNNRQSATEGLANGTGLAANREQAYQNAKAQTRSTNTGLATTAAMAALMFM